MFFTRIKKYFQEPAVELLEQNNVKTEQAAPAAPTISNKDDEKTATGKDASSSNEPVPAHKRGGVQLWQFLRQLLDNPDRRNIITWTRQGHDGEFKLLDPEEVARL